MHGNQKYHCHGNRNRKFIIHGRSVVVNIVIVSAIVSIWDEYVWWLIGTAAAIKCVCILLLTWYGRITGVCCHSIQSSLCIWSLISCCCLCSTEYEGSLSCHILYITSEMIACGSLCTWQEWPVVLWLHCSHAAVKSWIILWLVTFCLSLHIQYGIPLFWGCFPLHQGCCQPGWCIVTA